MAATLILYLYLHNGMSFITASATKNHPGYKLRLEPPPRHNVKLLLHYQQPSSTRTYRHRAKGIRKFYGIRVARDWRGQLNYGFLSCSSTRSRIFELFHLADLWPLIICSWNDFGISSYWVLMTGAWFLEIKWSLISSNQCKSWVVCDYMYQNAIRRYKKWRRIHCCPAPLFTVVFVHCNFFPRFPTSCRRQTTTCT
jgi:hypothetical protein